MKVKYMGVHNKVRYKGMFFERGKTVEINNINKFPQDFEIDGKPQLKCGHYTEYGLNQLYKKIGWKKFQEWAFEKYHVKDTKKSELIQEILKKQEGN